MRMITASHTTSGERSIPDIGGRRLRIGPRTGSVIRHARRVTGLVGYGLTHENTTRMMITTRNASSTKIRRPTIRDISSGRPRHKQDLAQPQHRASFFNRSLEISAHSHG